MEPGITIIHESCIPVVSLSSEGGLSVGCTERRGDKNSKSLITTWLHIYTGLVYISG